MALWKKIYIFLAVTIILALNIFVLGYAVRAEMPSYQRRNDPHYVEAVNVEIDRVMGFEENKADEIKQALPAGLAEYAVAMAIPDVILIGLAASIYKTKSYRDAGEDVKAGKHKVAAIVFGCVALVFILAVGGIFMFGYLPAARAATASINCH
jgi:hypothetical protein